MSKDKEIDQRSSLEKLENKNTTKAIAYLNKQRLEILGLIKRPKTSLKSSKKKSRLLKPMVTNHKIYSSSKYQIISLKHSESARLVSKRKRRRSFLTTNKGANDGRCWINQISTTSHP